MTSSEALPCQANVRQGILFSKRSIAIIKLPAKNCKDLLAKQCPYDVYKQGTALYEKSGNNYNFDTGDP